MSEVHVVNYVDGNEFIGDNKTIRFSLDDDQYIEVCHNADGGITVHGGGAGMSGPLQITPRYSNEIEVSAGVLK